MKKSKILPLVFSSLSLPIAMLPMSFISCNKNTPKPNPEPQKPNNPTNQKDKKLDEINNWLKNELNENLSIINGKEKEFHEAVKNENSFWYDRNSGKVITTKKGENPDWKNNKNYLLEFKGINIPKNYSAVNAKEPTWDNGQKLSSKLDYEIDKDNNIIFSYKAAIYDGTNKKHTISTEIGKTNLGKIIDENTLAKIEEMNQKANKETSFDYLDKANTYLKDADKEKIIKNIPDGYELATYKAIKNEEKEYYDITIIFKLKIKNSEITMLKNASYTIKGWKKTQEILDFENEAKNKINEQINKTKISILNEKAYQHIINHHTVNNFDGKPNFVVNGFDTNLYNVELINVKIEENNGKKIIKVSTKMSVKNNNDIFVEKEIQVEDEFTKGKNFHNLTKEQIKSYINEKLEKMVLYPKYSKDKTYIEKLNNGKITNNSFWIENIDHNLNNNFGSLTKEGDNYYVDIKTSILDWPDSPTITKKIKIDLTKLGIEILNEIRKNKGQDPLPDQFAPTSTIEEEVEPDLSLDKFIDTPEDVYTAKSAPQLNDFLSKINHLYAWDEEQYNIMKNNSDKKLIQVYKVSKEYIKKGNLYFYDNNASIRKDQTVYVFSKPEFVNNKLTIKITAIPLQDYNAGSIDLNKIASKRIEIKNDKWGKDLFDQYIKSLKLNEEINKLNLTYDFKDKGNLATKDVYQWTEEKIKENIIVNNLSSDYQIIKVKKSTKAPSNKKIIFFLYFKKDNIESSVPIKITISGFKE